MRKRLKLIYQQEQSECALACLAMMCNYHGANTSLSNIRERFPIPSSGLTLRNLASVAQNLGLTASVFKADLLGLKAFKEPVLLHWDMQHFVILKEVKNDMFIILDPARGERTFSIETISNHFTGIVVELTPNSDFKALNDRRVITILDVIKDKKLFLKPLFIMVFLSSLLEFFILSQPFILREQINSINDSGVNNVVMPIIILVTIALSLFLTTLIRDSLTAKVSSNLTFDISVFSFEQLMKFPLSYFERRQIGQVVERYRVFGEVQQFLSSSVPTAILDGLITILSIGFLFYLSLMVGCLAILTLLLYSVFKVLTYKSSLSDQMECAHTLSESNGHIIETIKSILTVKINGIEQRRFDIWTNFLKNQIDSEFNRNSKDAKISAMRTLIMSTNTVTLILICFIMFSNSSLSLGGIFAILLYNSHFLIRSTSFIDNLSSFFALNRKVSKVEDIISCQKQLQSRKKLVLSSLSSLSAESLTFKHEMAEKAVFEALNLSFDKNKLYVLCGDNGAGKTTLVNILLGLYQPSSGNLFYEGHAFSDIDHEKLREQCGVVTQNDNLFHGTILENLTTFDIQPDIDKVETICRDLGILECIESLPLGFHTRVGDTSTPLSAGETQKLFIARAMYKAELFFIMDEGTSNLDPDSERKVLEVVARMKLVKFVIAHRKAALDYADVILHIKNGKIETTEIERKIKNLS